MPKPRTPTNILQLSGALRRNPGRYAARIGEPKPSGPIGGPPDWMNEAEREAWAWIVSRCNVGTLGNSDEGIVELAATLRTEVVGRHADGRTRALLRLCYQELGMTPASRSKIQAPARAAVVNEFAAV